MTTFTANSGFSNVSLTTSIATEFNLLLGFNGLSSTVLTDTFFQLQKGFNSVSESLDISIGRLEYPAGTFYPQDGTARIINNVTNEFYTVPIVDGYFPIYPYTDSLGVPVEMVIGARIGSLRGATIITLTTPQIVTVILSEILSMAVKTTGRVLGRTTELNANNYDTGQCCYAERVFANPGQTWYQNDKSSFLLKKLTTLDTIVFKLYRNDVEVAVLSDNTYGELFDFDFYAGFIIHWELVYVAFGEGQYQIKADEILGGIPVEFVSQEFCLTIFSAEKANRTFRIETYQTGSIIRSGYNYDELGLDNGWYQSYRVPGKLGNKKATLESDYLMTSDRRMLQIQDRMSYEYELETELIPASLIKVLVEDNLLANQIQLTDYNLFNSQSYQRLELMPGAVNDLKSYQYNKFQCLQMTMKDRTDDILKRN